MFGLGQKKPAAPEAPWAVQILAGDYLVDGLIQPSEYKLGDEDVFARAAEPTRGIKAFHFLALTDVRVQPAGDLTSPVLAYSRWSLGWCRDVTAIVPRDDAGRAAAQAAFKDCRNGIAAVMYAGPYLIRGTALSDHETRLDSPLSADVSLLPVIDAEVDCQRPGARLTGFRAPYLLLHSGAIASFGLAR